MIWMLDTNICSYVMRELPASVKACFYQVGPENLAISTVVLAELRYGAARHPTRSALYCAEIDNFISRLEVLPWTTGAAAHYAELRTVLERQGQPIGNMDMLIAAHALAENAVLVTHNTREFERVPGLKVENWV
ncbi:type II toxin-antitoxin system tRNA(fMet)-specific endonuclease VapC [Allochromatium vinosum]|uniref:Ribonuclease VapC n=1 Tax=Allochromatium vinosum (strain ATCC 17899 / DSM 180 / NBRC 103801 / NCIMB 10441 / D) TaxID=572477 RepID=D3RPJ4_ALLVD|nr:type II toxin-antitoxin system VapC family toxin [Allochromatium vinosum]ADC61576.1 PilT protein domain protein [Allochromatium vinosum DSM 180]MBK1654539.1 PIN domain-containing protein [Allochromatium vinosum]